jgi:hypothetical protein
MSLTAVRDWRRNFAREHRGEPYRRGQAKCARDPYASKKRRQHENGKQQGQYEQVG